MDSSRPFDVQPLKTISLAGGNSLCDPLLLGHRTSGVQIILQPMRWKRSSVYQDIRLQVTDTQLELAYTRFTIKTAVAITKQMILTRKLLVPLAELKLKSQVSGNRKSKQIRLSGAGNKNPEPPRKCICLSLPSLFLSFLHLSVSCSFPPTWTSSLHMAGVLACGSCRFTSSQLYYQRKEPSSQLKYHNSISVKGKTPNYIKSQCYHYHADAHCYKTSKEVVFFRCYGSSEMR